MKHTLRRAIAAISLATAPGLFAQSPGVDATVLFVHGRVEIIDSSGVRAARRGDTITSSDRIITHAASSAQIRFSDGSLLALRPDTELVVSQYVYQPGSDTNVQQTDLIRGSLRAVSGAIGQATPERVTYNTPVATMGIRGTSLQVVHLVPGQQIPAELVGSYLYVETGQVAITTDAGEIVVLPGQLFFVSSVTDLPLARTDVVLTIVQTPSGDGTAPEQEQTDTDTQTRMAHRRKCLTASRVTCNRAQLHPAAPLW